MNVKIKQTCTMTLALMMAGCSATAPPSQSMSGFAKELSRTARYSGNLPPQYKLIHFKEKALDLDALLYDGESTGPYQPLSWTDETYHTIGIPAYVGDGRMHADGAQEAVTVIAGILSASQLGVDKANQNGRNYVAQMSAFFSEEERIVLNNPAGNSATTSMWYLIYPAILFSQVSILYPEESQIREQTLATIQSWYRAFQIMQEENDFSYTGFNFITNEPYRNQIWSEPDCAAGLAVLMYYGYALTANEAYLTAAKQGIAYSNDYFGSPLYEALLYFAPHMAALMNTKYATAFDTEDILDDVLNGSSIPRGGWGSIVGAWGDYDMSGLMGSTTDGGGYAFSMNTFAAAYALSATAKYDTRFAASLGKWLLHVASNSRYYFSDQTNPTNQAVPPDSKAEAFANATGHIVPFEGIRKSMNSQTPWFGGDPTVYGWAETDFSLYSGVHTGLLAALLEETNVEAILKIDLNKADLLHRDYPAFLLYNPHAEEKMVAYRTVAGQEADLFESVSKKKVAERVTDFDLLIPPGEAVVILELPLQANIQRQGVQIQVNDIVIASDTATLSVLSPSANDEVSGKFTIQLGCALTNEQDRVKQIQVTVDGAVFTFDTPDHITFHVSDLGTGSKTFFLEVKTEMGLTDRTQLRLNLK